MRHSLAGPARRPVRNVLRTVAFQELERTMLASTRIAERVPGVRDAPRLDLYA
jgi:hypothetical protein